MATIYDGAHREDITASNSTIWNDSTLEVYIKFSNSYGTSAVTISETLKVKIYNGTNSYTFDTNVTEISSDSAVFTVSAETLLSKGINIGSSFNTSIENIRLLLNKESSSNSYTPGNGDWNTYVTEYCVVTSTNSVSSVSKVPNSGIDGSLSLQLNVYEYDNIFQRGLQPSINGSLSPQSNIYLKYNIVISLHCGSIDQILYGDYDLESLPSSYTTTDGKVRLPIEKISKGYYTLQIVANKYFIGTEHIIGTYEVSDTSASYNFYPDETTEFNTISGYISILDAGNNSVCVDTSNIVLDTNILSQLRDVKFTLYYNDSSYNYNTNGSKNNIIHLQGIQNTGRVQVDVQNVTVGYKPINSNTLIYTEQRSSDTNPLIDTAFVYHTKTPTPNSPILTQVNDKTFTETPDKASRKANLTYTITPATSDESVDAYNIITHLLTKDDNGDELKYYIKLDKALNPHFVQSGTKQYDGNNFNNSAYGGFVKTQVDSNSITGHYPSPLEKLNKPLWKEDGTPNIQYVEWNGSRYYEVHNNDSIDTNMIQVIRWDGGVSSGLSDQSHSGTSEEDAIEIRTPSELAYLIQVRNSSTDTKDWTYGKYFKISDDIDAFDMCGHEQITLESTASEIKSLYSDGLYNINPDDYYGNHSTHNWYHKVTTTESADNIDCHCFSGTLDGNGCIIYNLYCGGTYGSLFPFIGIGATIKNIVLFNSRLWCWSSANSSNGASGILWGHMDNAEALRGDDNKNITISNCVIKDCYSNSNGTSLHHIGGTLRFVDMNISDCICADNILEICDKNTDGTTIDNLYIWGGLLGGARKADWTCHIDRCIVVGDDVHPLQICPYKDWDYIYKDDDEDHKMDNDAVWYEYGPLYHHDGDGENSDMIFKMVYDLPSDCYSNCYATNKVSESTEFATYLVPSQMKDNISSNFIDSTVYNTWYFPGVSNDTQLIDASLIVQIDLSNGVEVFNNDGTTKNYEVQSGDIIYLEVIPSIYNHGGYYTATSNSDCLSGNTTLKGAYIYVKLKDASGNEYYKYCPIYVKTENGYVEGIDTYKKNGNAYVLGI